MIFQIQRPINSIPVINYHHAILQTGIQAKVKTNIQLNAIYRRYSRLYILTFKNKHTLFYTLQYNLLSLHPQITSPTFYTLLSHLPHCFPISHFPQFLTPNLPPRTFFLPPISHLRGVLFQYIHLWIYH